MVVEGGDSWRSMARVQIQRKAGCISSVAHGTIYSSLGSLVVGKTPVL